MSQFKDPLEYTKEELETLSTEDLEAIMKIANDLESLFNTSQLVKKLLMNSLYGALANRYFPLFNLHMARAITGNGRYFIQKMAKEVESGLQALIPYEKGYVFYGDTDSNYFTVAPFVEKAFKDKPDATIVQKTDFCNRFYEQVVDNFVQKSIDDFGKEFNAYNTDVIGSEREIIADSGVWTAKKKYFARVIDSEGVRYKEPKLKVMGLDIIRSGTPTFVKKKLKESLTIILDSDVNTMIEWKDEVEEDFKNQPLSEIAKVQGVSNIDYAPGVKGVPMGARAVIVHNNYVKKIGIENEVQLLDAGNKVKIMYLQEPNIFGSNVIAWSDDKFAEIVKQSGCVDYNLCFEKFMLSPLELMTTALKWDVKRTTESLDDW